MINLLLILAMLSGCATVKVIEGKQRVICGGGYCNDKRIFIGTNIDPYTCESIKCEDSEFNCYQPKDEMRKYCKKWCDVNGCGASCGYCEEEYKK